MRLVFLFIAIIVASWAFAQQSVVLSGPMPGYTTMTEVGIWLQLRPNSNPNDPAPAVAIEYFEIGRADSTHTTPSHYPSSAEANTLRFAIGNLKPGKTYGYRVLVDGASVPFSDALTFTTLPLWQFRTDPPAFSVALGSCTYINEPPYDRPGKPYGQSYSIFDRIADQKPNAMLWLGDNTYLREVDWSSRSGYLHRYTHTRSLPELQRLLRATHHYAIWDDHDFGPNDANGSWVHKDWALEAFQLFWMNPSYGVMDDPGITTAFQFNDIDFFLLDNRYNRTPDQLADGDEEILGEDQIEWLIAALKYSRAPFKIVAVGGQVLNPAAVYETHAVYGDERAYLLERIEEENIRGVVFVTGDRHHTELTKYVPENGNVIYDLTVSPLTSSSHSDDGEKNTLRVDGTLVNTQNFALLEFSGPRKSRQLKISIFDSNGALIWSQIIESQ